MHWIRDKNCDRPHRQEDIGLTPEALIHQFDEWRPEMLALLEQLVNIDSGTGRSQGAAEIVDILAEKFGQLGLAVERHQTPVGPQLVVYGDRQPQVLLSGHIDTVFPPGTASRRPYRTENGRAYGPGVTDMKSGVVNMLYVVKALAADDGELHRHVRLVINCDEETSSLHSRPFIQAEAERCVAAFVFEPSSKMETLTTERKGVGVLHVTVKGQAAHAGSSFHDGVSAIEELARIITGLHALNDPEADYSINVGLMSGGTARNVVAEEAEATVDLRFPTPEKGEELLAAVQSLCRPSKDGLDVQVSGGFTRPPLVRTDSIVGLFRHVQEAGQAFGIRFEQSSSGGVSDANLIAAAGIPVIDSMGPIGGKVHSDSEFLELDSIGMKGAVATYAIARLLQQLAEQPSAPAFLGRIGATAGE